MFSQSLIASALFAVLRGIPLSLRRQLGSLIASGVALLPLREKSVATLQLRWHLPSQDYQLIYRQMMRNFGIVGAEVFSLSQCLQTVPIDISGAQETLNSIGKGRPVLLLSAHLSNWELLAAYIASHSNVPLGVIAAPGRRALFHELLSRVRAEGRVESLWRDDPSAKRRLVEFMKNGWTIGALIDQDTRVDAIDSEFLGHYAKTPSSIITAAQRYNAIIVTLFIVRTASGYRLESRRAPDGMSTEQIVALYNDHLGQLVRNMPEQWVWIHKRWRSRKGAEPFSSVEYLEFMKGNLV